VPARRDDVRQCGACGGVGDIHRQGQCPVAAELADEGRCGVKAQGGEHHVGSACLQRAGGGRTDASRGAVIKTVLPAIV
jgi:hypothetical protein